MKNSRKSFRILEKLAKFSFKHLKQNKNPKTLILIEHLVNFESPLVGRTESQSDNIWRGIIHCSMLEIDSQFGNFHRAVLHYIETDQIL